ncbi:hypothetical protein GSH19_00045 [Lactobacillus sp. S2-2]|uniref:GH25 family lysozyme n=1 Tax=Lactobacillus sp. S2-2 TaxID=2692917 RepID=UPI001F315B76|nr:GH25 family lysozyme [Lactobacillus sp. S2-2]MCF6514576.1 hypothetical protein [Lactobacillus sp. S2-2]
MSFKRTIIIMSSLLLFTLLGCNVSADQTHKGTMGYNYSKNVTTNKSSNLAKMKVGSKSSNSNLKSNFSQITSQNPVYDVSEWQGKFTAAKVKKLKNEVPFIILRVQYGSAYADKTFEYNKSLMEKYNVPYGVYSFSQYENSSDAAYEAKTLYQKAPNAKFYINDYEDQTVTSGSTNDATNSWVNEIRKYSGNKKVLFYSYQSFMLKYASKAISNYDGYWLAAYQNSEPTREHVLWQFTDNYYSSALNLNLDASVSNSKNTSWFIGNTNEEGTVNNNNSTNNNVDSNVSTTTPAKYQKINKTMTIKNSPANDFYLHVPKDTRYKNKRTYFSKNYASKNVTVNSKGINSKDGVYYRAYYKGKKLGWIRSSSIGPLITYKNTNEKLKIVNNPKSHFYNHVTNSKYSVKKKYNGNTFANQTITTNKVATKDGYSHKYYRCYANGKLIGWIYGASILKK